MSLKIEKHIDVRGRKREIILKAFNEVLEEFEERVKIKKMKGIRLFVTLNPVKTCEKIILPKGKLRRHSELREWICRNSPSFSYWERDSKPTIMVDANQKIFRELNYQAIKGLFAHELMHLVDKLEKIEDNLNDVAEETINDLIGLLRKHREIPPFTIDRLLSSFIRITISTVLFMKDIFANTRAMSFGFDEEIYANYKAVLEGVKEEIKFTERGIMKALKEDRKHILDNAFLTYLGLNTCWVPFKMFHNKWYKELKELADIKVPKVVKDNCKEILKEMLKLRSASDREQIARVLRLTQQKYFNIVRYFCKKLKSSR